MLAATLVGFGIANGCANTPEDCAALGGLCDCNDANGNYVECQPCSATLACDCGCPDGSWVNCDAQKQPMGSCNGTGGSGASGGSGTAGTGAGGSSSCDQCAAPTPLCDESTHTCVACLQSSDCTDPTAARCDAGACVPCVGAEDCTHLTNAGVCDSGTCVQCALGAEGACTGSHTCDLVAKNCVDVAAGSAGNCKACSNDNQCASGFNCIAMDFDGNAYGYYCLQQDMANCVQPFSFPINKGSISGAAAAGYCGIDQSLVSCEAVLALIGGWYCSGTDGMCSPDGVQPEVAVPGALCRKVGTLTGKCTYTCTSANDCLTSGSGSTCGGTPLPTWCGG